MNRQKNAILLPRKIQPILKDEVWGAVVIFSLTTAQRRQIIAIGLLRKKQQISYSYSNGNHLNRQKNAIWLTRKIQPMLKDEIRGAVVIFSHTTALMHEKKSRKTE